MSHSDPVSAAGPKVEDDTSLDGEVSSPDEPCPTETPRTDYTTDTSQNNKSTDTFNVESTAEASRKVPSLRSISDFQNMNPSSTPLGMLETARYPPQMPASFAGAAGMNNNAMAKVRAFLQERKQLQERMQRTGPSGANSPLSSVGSPSTMGNGHPVPLRMPTMPHMPSLPGAMQRPGPPPHPKSAPNLPKPSLSERRANAGMGLRLPDAGGGSPSPGMKRPGAPMMLDMSSSDSSGKSGTTARGTKLDDFKKYIDAEKGWITFDGAATITRTGVNFSNGQTFSISLDEVETLGELGKGNYGTVYKVRHAKPAAPRFGHGLSAYRQKQTHRRSSAAAQDREKVIATLGTEDHYETSGKILAMKEIRLELDDSKFTTILKELVILHECVSPYIIDFYGAFFQEGAVYICIEYMDGGSIDKLYAGGIPENILRKITYSSVMGLKSLKDDHNIIHRDVKPTNILANTQGHVKICDFGVSGNLVASIAKTNIGCQSYMAPERISGGALAQSGNPDGSYNVLSDIWSLGLTIIECAIGRYPYPPESSSTIFSQLNAIVEGEPPNLPETGYSDVARDFVKNCLHKIPKMRASYAMLLQHPWLKPLSKPETIIEATEEAEVAEVADKVSDMMHEMDVNSVTGDREIAEWVKSVLQRKEVGLEPSGPTRPALHAVPLDSVSPMGSPLLHRK